MRTHALLFAGFCLLSTSAGAAQAAKPSAIPAASAPKKASDAKATARKEVKLSDKVLKSYVGEYEMAPGRILTVTLENGSLWGQPTDQQKRQLFAESSMKFFLKDIDAQVAFQKDAKGNVTGMVMNQAGRPERQLKKIK